MQPTYLGWVGYFDMIDQADVFVLLDNVAISKQSWQTRNRIRARDGNVVWLSVPTNARMGQTIAEVTIADRPWAAKHKRTIESAYSHAAHWDWAAPMVFEPWTFVRLVDLNHMTLFNIAWDIGIRTKLRRASSLARQRHNPIHRLADICQSVGATEYLSPEGARGYLEGQDIGVPIRWHQYEPAEYDQGGQPWMPYLSIVDALAWNGPNTLDIIRAGRV